MAQIERRNLYQPQKLSQGFNPVRAADVTPFLRENQQTRMQEMQRQDKAAARDFEMQVKDEQLKALNANRDTAALLAFAPKAQERLQEFAKDQIAQEKVNAIQWLADQKEERDSIIRGQQAVEGELQQVRLGEQFEQTELADEYKNNPAMSYSLIDEANKSSSWAQFYRVQLATQQASQDIVNDLENDIKSDSIVESLGKRWSELNEEEWDYAWREKEGQLLKANNITQETTLGMDLTHGQPTREKAKTKLRDRHTKNYYINESQKRTALDWAQVIQEPTVENLAIWFSTKSRELKSDGKTLVNFNGAQNKFFEQLRNIAKTDQLGAEDILNAYKQLELNGVPFETLHKGRIGAYYDERLKDIKGNVGQVEDILEDMATRAAQQSLNPIARNEESTLTDVLEARKKGLDFFNSQGIGHLFDPKKIGYDDAMKNITYSGQEMEELEYQAQYRADRGKLDDEFFDKLPPELQAKFLPNKQRQEELDGLKVSTAKEDFKGNILRNSYVKESAASDKAAWGNLLFEDLWQEILADADNMMSSPDNVHRTYADAVLAATEKVSARFLLGVNDKNSIYYHGDEGYRAYLEHKVGDIDEKTTTFRRRHDKLMAEARLIGRSALAKPGYVGTNEYLLDVKNRAENGQMDSYIQALVKQLGGTYYDTLNLILRSNGLEELDMDYQPPPLNPSVQADVDRVFKGTATRMSNFRLTSAVRAIRPNLAQVLPAIKPENLGNMDPSGIDWQAPASNEGIRQKGDFIMKYMTEDLKMGNYHALGILLNVLRESRIRTAVRKADGTPVGDGGEADYMFQWNGKRRTDAARALGEYWTDPRAQIRYALEEPGEPGQEYLRQNFTSALDAAYWFAERWERPFSMDHSHKEHIRLYNVWQHGGTF